MVISIDAGKASSENPDSEMMKALHQLGIKENLLNYQNLTANITFNDKLREHSS